MEALHFEYDAPFTLESGATLPRLTIAYHTYGQLSPSRDNVIWVCHALTANSEVADWWPHTVEQGRFLDPSRHFIVCANILGSHYGTTGPLHTNPATGRPYYGTFPNFTIRDMVRAHRLLADALGIEREGHDFLWVVDFPLFHWDDDAKRYEAEHQPFTLPHVDQLDLLETNPLAMGSCTYDFVMDGFEAGGGGMRIHDAELQLKMLEFMGFTEERAKEQFGFLMEALTFGAPPMGGFALGLDRVCMLLAGSDSIRDVMAFPKTSSGSDLMSGAPSAVSLGQLKEVSLRLR